MKEYKDEFAQTFLAWCIHRGITRRTPRKDLLIALTEEHECKMALSDAKRVITRLHRQDASAYEVIQQLKASMEDLMRQFYDRWRLALPGRIVL